MKIDIPDMTSGIDEEKLKEMKKRAIDDAHDTIDYIIKRNGEVTHPVVLVLEVSHILSHILLAAPRKQFIMMALKTFLEDLDIQSIHDAWDHLEEEDEDDGSQSVH